MELSLAKTLAGKLKISVSKVFKRYKTRIQTDNGPRKVLMVKVEEPGKKPLVTYWGGVSLARDNTATLTNKRPRSSTVRQNSSSACWPTPASFAAQRSRFRCTTYEP